jgi:hypothetical protein
MSDIVNHSSTKLTTKQLKYRELEMTTVDIAKRLKISQSAARRFSLRGQKIAEDNNFTLTSPLSHFIYQ